MCAPRSASTRGEPRRDVDSQRPSGWSRQLARPLPLSPLLHDPALGLAARLPLAAHELAVALAQVEAAEEVRLDLEDRRPALLRVPAVHVAARVWGAVELGEEDQGREHC